MKEKRFEAIAISIEKPKINAQVKHRTNSMIDNYVRMALQ